MNIPKITLENAKKNFEIFTTNTQRNIKRHTPPKKQDFAADLNKFQPVFEQPQFPMFLYKSAKKFAEMLVGAGQDDFASIVYSFLIKYVKDPKLSEELAINSRAIAKRNHDNVHVAARSVDIKNLKKGVFPKSEEHLKWLDKNCKDLRKIINHYEHSQNNYLTISRKIKPKESYEKALAQTLFEKSKILKKKRPEEVVSMLDEAVQIFERLNCRKELEGAKTLKAEVEKIIAKKQNIKP